MTTTKLKAIELICKLRHGVMDDKQFKATVEYNISNLEAQIKNEIINHLPDDESDYSKHLMENFIINLIIE